MKQDVQSGYVRWLICLVVALLICVAVILYEMENTQWELVRMLCDGCFVSGILLTGFGLLAWIASFHGFAALGYAWYLLTRAMSPSKARFEERLSYLEYVQTHSKKKSSKCVLVTGVVFLALSLVFLWFYYQ